MSELSLAERVSPRAENAQLIFSYAADPQCPNADYFLEQLFQWIEREISSNGSRLKIDSAGHLQPRDGVSWAEFFPGLRPIQIEGVVDDTLNSSIRMLKERLASINTTLDSFKQSRDSRIQSMYQKLQVLLQSLKPA